MRRLVTGPVDYLRRLLGAVAGGWDRFFFTPADPTALGLIRVATGLLLLRSLWVIGLDLPGFLGSRAWTDPEAVRGWMAEQAHGAWSFWLLVPDSLLRPVWIVCLAVLAMFTAGLFSRTTAVLAWIIAVSTARRAPTILFGFDNIIATWTLYLAACGASGQAVSLDRFLSRWKAARAALARRPKGVAAPALPSGVPVPTVSANLGLRLIQLHLCLIYGMAALAKLRGDAWWNGLAIWGVLASAEFRRFDLTWMAAYPWLLNFLTHAGLFLELTYPVLVWVPVLRPLMLVAMLGLHIGINLSLGLTEFGLAMLAGNLAFVSGPWLRSLVAGDAGDRPAGRVLYDGQCPRCRRSAAILLAADPAAVVHPIDLNAVDVATIHPELTPEACLRSMHLVRDDGRVVAGFDAVATLARWLPLFWPLGIVAGIPGVAVVGRRAYNALAASRPRDVPCTDETCALPPASAPTAPAAGRTRR
jgi:predicted DCC family thiol-disulfide oxidoreductase YuxK